VLRGALKGVLGRVCWRVHRRGGLERRVWVSKEGVEGVSKEGVGGGGLIRRRWAGGACSARTCGRDAFIKALIVPIVMRRVFFISWC